MFPIWGNKQFDMMLFQCPNNCCTEFMSQATEKLSSVVFLDICDNLNSGMSEYKNFCFHCCCPIVGNDNTLERDPIRSLGYKCPECGKTLRDKLIRDGIIKIKQGSSPSDFEKKNPAEFIYSEGLYFSDSEELYNLQIMEDINSHRFNFQDDDVIYIPDLQPTF